MEYAIQFLARVVAVIFVFSPHEFAHAYIAYKNGDPTAKIYGRMTLNPIKHFDVAGFVLCALVGFGWAKPVPVNSSNFRNYKVGTFTTAIAGVVANYIVAFFAYLIFVLITRFLSTVTGAAVVLNYFIEFIRVSFLYIFFYSLYSFCFNLLPLFPLDGFRVVQAFTREINPVHRFLRNYGQVILIVLVAESYLCSILESYVPYVHYFNVLGYVSWFAQNVIGFPIKAAWGWILNL